MSKRTLSISIRYALLIASALSVTILSPAFLMLVEAEAGGLGVFDPPKDRYGAIAYSPSAQRYGSSWNQPNGERAEQEAMRMCNRSDCKVLLTLENSCGSLAVARNGGYVWAEGSSLYEAKLRASNRCTAEHRSCKLRCSVCSGGDVP